MSTDQHWAKSLELSQRLTATPLEKFYKCGLMDENYNLLNTCFTQDQLEIDCQGMMLAYALVQRCRFIEDERAERLFQVIARLVSDESSSDVVHTFDLPTWRNPFTVQGVLRDQLDDLIECMSFWVLEPTLNDWSPISDWYVIVRSLVHTYLTEVLKPLVSLAKRKTRMSSRELIAIILKEQEGPDPSSLDQLRNKLLPKRERDASPKRH